MSSNRKEEKGIKLAVIEFYRKFSEPYEMQESISPDSHKCPTETSEYYWREFLD